MEARRTEGEKLLDASYQKEVVVQRKEDVVKRISEVEILSQFQLQILVLKIVKSERS